MQLIINCNTCSTFDIMPQESAQFIFFDLTHLASFYYNVSDAHQLYMLSNPGVLLFLELKNNKFTLVIHFWDLLSS